MSSDRLSRSLVRVSMTVLLVIASGCDLWPLRKSQATPDATPEATPWEKTLRDVGYVSVWPPREDVRVGDFFVFPVNPEASFRNDPTDSRSREIMATTRWGSLSMVTELQAEYQNRPSWPRTSDIYLQTGDATERREWHESLDTDRSIFGPRETTRRLRLVALNAIPAITYSQGDLNALIPVEVFNIVNGSGWGNPTAIMIKPGPAEGYSVPLSQIVQRLLDERISGGKRHFFLKPEFQQRLNLGGRDNILWVQVVSEVLYLRTVDVAVVTEPGPAGEQELHASELQPINTSENEPQAVPVAESEVPADAAAIPPSTPPPTVVVERSADVDDKLDPVYGAFARAQAINRVLMESNTDRVSGSIVRFLSVTDDSVSIRRIWKRGIAVGVRGLTLEVDTRTGKVVRIGAMGVPLPEDKPEEAKEKTKEVGDSGSRVSLELAVTAW